MRKFGILILILVITTYSQCVKNPKYDFEVHIRQNGIEMPIVNGAVTIKRDEFDFVFTSKENITIFVNGWTKPTSYNMAVKKLYFQEITGLTPGCGMAEGRDNSEYEFSLQEGAFHCWYYSGDDNKRYNEVDTSNGYTYVRTIKNLFYENKTLPISQFSVNSTPNQVLYFVFVSNEWIPEQSEYIEYSRHRLRIILQ